MGRVIISVASIVDVNEEFDDRFADRKEREYSTVDLPGHGFVVCESFNEILEKLEDATNAGRN